MNGAEFHLLLNHAPLFAILIGLALLLTGLMANSEDWKEAGLGLFFGAALVCIPTYLTGEPAEEVVEHMPGVSESFIEEHEEWAEASLVAVELLGVLALAGIISSRRRSSIARLAVMACLILAIVACAMIAWTAHLGGEIHHPETRAGFQVPIEEKD
jgi:uncharacterized membrane protein